MINPEVLLAELRGCGVDFFVGVPDSLLKEFCAYVDAALGESDHLIAANEGTALAIAAGRQLATGGVPFVYLQNSGLGNLVNPLLSLADPDVYSIPMVLLVGWRGEPGVSDEPQHQVQGAVTVPMLEAMEVPYRVLSPDEAQASRIAKEAVELAQERSGPVVLLVSKGTFAPSPLRKEPAGLGSIDQMSREDAISVIVDALPDDCSVVASTGHISRELFEIRERTTPGSASDFLTVGSMGHASQIALGVALGRTNRQVVCLDGDGAALMHLGGMATIGAVGPRNVTHIVLNNGVHDSVGAQPTVADTIDLSAIARACGYVTVSDAVSSADEIRQAIGKCANTTGPTFIEVAVRPGARADLGRPSSSPTQNKAKFVAQLGPRGV